MESLRDGQCARYICREEKVLERGKMGVYIPFTHTHVSKAVHVKLQLRVTSP